MLRYIGFAMIGVGVLLIVLSIIFMIVWNIPDLLDEVSGRKDKRMTDRLRKSNSSSTQFDGNTDEFYGLINDKTLIESSTSTLDEDNEYIKALKDAVYSGQTKGSIRDQLVKSSGSFNTSGDMEEQGEYQTGMLDETDEDFKLKVSTIPVGKHNIKILKEQTSLV